MDDDDRIVAPQSVGEALRLLRERAGLKRDEAAALAGMSGGTLSRYENDATRKPNIHAMQRISSALARRLGADPGRVWLELQQILEREAATLDPQEDDPDELEALDAAGSLVVVDDNDDVGAR